MRDWLMVKYLLTKEESKTINRGIQATSRYTSIETLQSSELRILLSQHSDLNRFSSGIHTCLFPKVTSSTKTQMWVAKKAAIVASSWGDLASSFTCVSQPLHICVTPM